MEFKELLSAFAEKYGVDGLDGADGVAELEFQQDLSLLISQAKLATL